MGVIKNNGQYDFGNGVTVSGNYASNGYNAVIVKYNSAGLAQWANSTTTAPHESKFNNVVLDSSGNILATGGIKNNGQYDFGNSVTVSGNYATGYNSVILKYNSAGVAQWAESTTTAPAASEFNDLTLDNSSNIYAVGYINGNGEYNFGNGVTVSGNSAVQNTAVVKFNSAGVAQWAKSTVSAPADSLSELQDVVLNPSGGIYTVGSNGINGEFDFGNSVTANGASEAGNVLIISYNAEGTSQWAKSTPTAPQFEVSIFYGVTVSCSGSIYAVGQIDNTDPYSFGSAEATVSGANAGNNAVIVQYVGDAPDSCPISSPSFSSASTFENLPGDDRPVNLDEGGVVTEPVYTIEVKPSGRGIVKVEFYIDDNLICTDQEPDSQGVYSCDWDTTEYHSAVRIIAYYNNGRTITLTRNVEVQSAMDQVSVLPETGADQFNFLLLIFNLNFYRNLNLIQS